MNDDLEQLLQNLKLKTIAARFDEMFAAAEQLLYLHGGTE